MSAVSAGYGGMSRLHKEDVSLHEVVDRGYLVHLVEEALGLNAQLRAHLHNSDLELRGFSSCEFFPEECGINRRFQGLISLGSGSLIGDAGFANMA